MYLLLSDGGSPRLVKKTEVELAIKPLYPTSIGNTLAIQRFLTNSMYLYMSLYIYIYIYMCVCMCIYVCM